MPEQRVGVSVSDGWVKLDGTVDSQHQKLAAERVVRTLTGVRGVTNLIKVTPKVQPADIETKITGAFQRSAVLDARGIQVATRDGLNPQYDEALAALRHRAASDLDTLADELYSHEATVTTHVANGHAAEVILDEAALGSRSDCDVDARLGRSGAHTAR